jgi:hypothetical protein
VQAFLRPLLERAGLVEATNEAWAMIAALVLLAPIILTLVGAHEDRGIGAQKNRSPGLTFGL